MTPTDDLLAAGRDRLDAGEHAAAEAIARQILRASPSQPGALHLLGQAAWRAGQRGLALAFLQQAAALTPARAEFLLSLGRALRGVNRPEDAIESFRRALANDPANASGWFWLGTTLLGQGRLDEAVAALTRALEVDPDHARARVKLGQALAMQGRPDAAAETFERALVLRPDPGVHVRLATILPVIPESTTDLATRRAGFDAALSELQSTGLRLDDPLEQVGDTSFYLAYHGMDDRPLQEKLARLYASACPTLGWVAPRCAAGAVPTRPDGRYRVGFISRFLSAHTIAHLNRGLLTRLSRDRFHISVFVVPPGRVDRRIREAVDQVVELPASLADCRQWIADEALDLLYYTDIGMEPVTYFLAFARLAPVQCVTWGHPVTTGLSSIDYFISSKDLEPPGSDRYYTERLVRLDRLSTYYFEPELDHASLTRDHFGLDDDWHLYVCPQTLFKLHPDLDRILAEIVEADPLGRVVLIDGQSRHWAAALKARFERCSRELADRTVIVPRLSRPELLSLLRLADVLLDPPHFSGGNTSLEAFAVGAPIVTWPGELLRSRITAACYAKMELSDCVVSSGEAYVRLALRLANDPAWRDQVRTTILERNAVLYQDIEVVREYERFFARAIDAAYEGAPAAGSGS